MSKIVIDNWRQAPRMASIWVALALFIVALLQYVQTAVLPLAQPFISPLWWPLVSGGFGVAIIAARLWKQWLGVGSWAAQSPPDADGPTPMSEDARL